MRRFTAILLAVILVLSFCGCSYDAYSTDSTTSSFLDKLRESDTEADEEKEADATANDISFEDTESEPDTTEADTTDAPDTTALETVSASATTFLETTSSPETTATAVTVSPETSAEETSAKRDIPYEENYSGHVYTGGEKSTKYHYLSSCAGKYSHEITWEEVDSSGLEPCKKCVMK